MITDNPVKVLLVSSRRDWLPDLQALLGDGQAFRPLRTTMIDQLLTALKEFRPRVVILDHKSTNGTMRAWLAAIRKADPVVEILTVCEGDCAGNCHDLFDYRVKGCVSESVGAGLLARGVEVIARGDMWLPRPVLERRLEFLHERMEQQQISVASEKNSESPLSSLTERERIIAECVVQGLTNKQIAYSLEISDETVKSHLRNMFSKLNVRRRTELAALLAAADSPIPAESF